MLSAKNKNVYLIGLMGAGKSTLGRALARKLNRPFYDSDQELQTKCGVAVSVIFDLEGEVGFRQRESQVLQELVQHKGIILATGGGAILREENRMLLKQNGAVIYLRATPEDLWLRLCHDRSRPLLQAPNPQNKLSALYAQRDPLYLEIADFVIETGKPNLTRLLHIITQQLESAGIILT